MFHLTWNSSQKIVSHGRCGNYLFKFHLMNDKLAEVSGPLDPGISATTAGSRAGLLGWAGLGWTTWPRLKGCCMGGLVLVLATVFSLLLVEILLSIVNTYLAWMFLCP